MLFNSLEFLYAFLPITFAGFFLLGRWGWVKGAQIWLTFASLVFYSYWNPRHLPLILISILLNYGIGWMLFYENDSRLSERSKRFLFILGIVINVGLLGYFKYSTFIVENVHFLLGHLPQTRTPQILPLAISFFTFTQIAFLTDCYSNRSQRHGFLEYSLFVVTFPHLIAGPIVHHAHLIPQFQKKSFLKLNTRHIAVGLILLTVGLFKKLFIADNLSAIATPIFKMADSGQTVSLSAAWTAIIAYTLQIYFDFSAYSEMAIGLGLFFNLHLPVNFLSPYQSKNFSEYWRRWHITLSDFIRNYLFNPLVMALSRRGNPHIYLCLVATMLVAGLWHGASWNFIFWGFLNGVFLVIHRIWQSFFKKYPVVKKMSRLNWPFNLWGMVLTSFFVTVIFVFVRATTWSGAISILHSLISSGNPNHGIDFFTVQINNGINLFGKHILSGDASRELKDLIKYGFPALWLFLWLMPNMMTMARPLLDHSFFSDSKVVGGLPLGQKAARAASLGLGFGLGILLSLVSYQIMNHDAKPFIYFDF